MLAKMKDLKKLLHALKVGINAEASLDLAIMKDKCSIRSSIKVSES